MRDYTQTKLDKLLAETGHELCLADFADIQELDEIAGRVAGILDGHERACYFPVEVGGTLLYPLTIAKAQFIEDNEINDLGLVYVLSLSKDDVDGLVFGKPFSKAVRKFKRGLKCTQLELSDAVDSVLSLSNGDGENAQKSKTDWPMVIDMLCANYGADPDYWLYDAQLSLVGELIARMTTRKSAEAQEENKASDNKIIALKEFREKMNEISEKWSRKDG